MIAYKAFKKGLIATKGGEEYQYNEGWNEFPEAHCVKCGAHCAENPLDMFNYYHNINETEFRLVKAEGDIHENGSDSKIACTRLFVGKKLTIEEVAAHALNYMRRYPNRSKKRFDLKGYFHILRDKHPLLSGKKGEWLCFAVGDESFIEQIGMLYIDGKNFKEDVKYDINGNERMKKHEQAV